MDTTNIAMAKEPLLSLMLGAIMVVVMTLPYFYGIGKAIQDRRNDREFGLLKFLVLPFTFHLFASLCMLFITRAWDLFYPNLQSGHLISIFWSATAEGATNAWVKAAYNSAEFMSLALFYLLVAIPVINFGVVGYILNDRILPSQMLTNTTQIKIATLKIVAITAVVFILTMFYFATIDLVMFNGQTINFKTYGSASTMRQLNVNFYKKIVKAGITGKSVAPSNASSYGASGGSSPSSSDLLNAYFKGN